MAEEQEPSVRIGLKEIYDKQIETHAAVTNIIPRLARVESQIQWLWRALGAVALAVFVAWLSKHML